MAINDERDERMHKASALDDDSLSTQGQTHTDKRTPKKRGGAMHSKRRSMWQGVLVDIVILLLLVGIGVGIWFGYQAIKNIYQPVFEERAIECVVKIDGIDYKRADELLPTLLQGGVWYSDRADGVYMGQVTEVVPVASITGEGHEIMTLYITVEVASNYYPKDGYYVENIRMLAGEKNVFRASGLIAEGMIISITDPSMEATQQQDTKEVK